jgi:hypothetical protein
MLTGRLDEAVEETGAVNERKRLLAGWSKERVDAFLRAERSGKVEEVEGGWRIDGHFMTKFPITGEALTDYFEWLAEEGEREQRAVEDDKLDADAG